MYTSYSFTRYHPRKSWFCLVSGEFNEKYPRLPQLFRRLFAEIFGRLGLFAKSSAKTRHAGRQMPIARIVRVTRMDNDRPGENWECNSTDGSRAVGTATSPIHDLHSERGIPSNFFSRRWTNAISPAGRDGSTFFQDMQGWSNSQSTRSSTPQDASQDFRKRRCITTNYAPIRTCHPGFIRGTQ